MKKIFARSRGLLVIVALVMIAAMSGVPTARAASPAGAAGGISAAPHSQAAPGASASPSGQCTFVGVSTCQSTDPTVAVSTDQTGNSDLCTFVWDVNWGDGSSSQRTLTDPPPGWAVLVQHTYAAAGMYTITATGQATGPDCTITPFTLTFTLLAPSPPSSLPTTPSPAFVCVTGPGGSCLGAGAGVPQQDTWAPIPPAWLTSPVTGGCALSVIELLTAIYAPEFEWLVLVEALGGTAYFEQSSGNLLFKLAAAMPFKDCYELATYVLKHQSPPSGLQSKVNPLASTGVLAGHASLQSLFQPVSKSQLKKLGKLPSLRQRFGYMVAQVGSEAALSKKYGTSWSSGTHKSVVCKSQRGGYRCTWRFQHNGTHYAGYVLIAARGNSYRLEKVVRL